MHIETIELGNYKCFLDAQTIKLEHGFNLFVGANNSGKTTMLEALDLVVSADEPHRSIKNIVQYGDRAAGQSRLQVKLSTDFQELRRLIGNDFYIPLPEGYAIARGQEQSVVDQLLNKRVSIEITFGAGKDSVQFETVLGRSGSISRNNHSGAWKAIACAYGESAVTPSFSISNFGGIGPSVGSYHDRFKPYIYRFSAQRRQVGECLSTRNASNEKLDRDAGNLPFCINHLQTNDAHGHKQLCEWVSRIFPSVKWIQAPPVENNNFRLFCAPLLPEERRDDLAIPLARMGAGISNVIAMLYVVLTSRQPQVIAIDEPNLFLHPRALRELLQILSIEGKHHQIILTAHSPEVLTSVKPSLITMFEFDGASTKTIQVDAKNISTIRVGLSDLGIRMTDLHGRDQVLWVEGQTEEIVMPELLKLFCPEIAAGTAVLRVEHTGTFEKKGVAPAEVAKLYSRLTTSSALVPPMIAILLDGESRGEDERKRLERESAGVLRFLDRTMLENYVLDPEAISVVLNGLGENVTLEQVQNALRAAGYTGVEDVRAIHGANILKKVFSELSDARHAFTKTRDVPDIISWMIENKPKELQPLGDCLRNVAHPKS